MIQALILFNTLYMSGAAKVRNSTAETAAPPALPALVTDDPE